MEYFELLNITPSFILDESQLRKQFLLAQSAAHPDLDNANSDEFSAKLNQAYKVLKDFWLRCDYILSFLPNKELIDKKPLSAVFLMEMMELNEQIELTDTDEIEKENLRKKIMAMQTSLQNQIIHRVRFSNSMNEILQSENESGEISELLKQRMYFYRLLAQLQ